MTVLRVVVADADLLLRRELEQLMSAEEDLRVVAVCAYAAEVATTVTKLQVDVVVAGIGVAGGLVGTPPAVGVVLIAPIVDRARLLDLLAEGNSRGGYVLARQAVVPGRLATVVRAVAAGETYVDPQVVETLVDKRSADPTSRLHRLTPRERTTIAAIAGGGSNLAIGIALDVSHVQIAHHADTALTKLGIPAQRTHQRRTRAVIAFLVGRP